MIITLTVGERERFAEWLEQEAAADKLLLEQMERMQMTEFIVSARKRDIESALVVAKKLRGMESQVISRSETS